MEVGAGHGRMSTGGNLLGEKVAVTAGLIDPDQEEHGTKFSARNVNVRYGSNHAIKDVDVDIPDKMVTAFIGPSGCGKSTFLRCLNRMNDTIDTCEVTGEILLDRQDIYGRAVDPVQLRARVGMVFQKPNPFPKSVYDNVAYGPRIHGLTNNRAELDAVVEQCLRRAALWREVKDRLHEPGTGLSGGQQQRLCIARAVATAPEVLLMDEPLLGARSDRNCPDRGADRRIAAKLLGGHRHPFHAAGGASQPEDGVLPPRGDGGAWRNDAGFHQSRGSAYAGLYHRALWLIANSRGSNRGRLSNGSRSAHCFRF